MIFTPAPSWSPPRATRTALYASWTLASCGTA
jgi:hypothetical protein